MSLIPALSLLRLAMDHLYAVATPIPSGGAWMGMGRLLWHTLLVNTHTTLAKKKRGGGNQEGKKGIGDGTSIPLIRLKVFRQKRGI